MTKRLESLLFDGNSFQVKLDPLRSSVSKSTGQLASHPFVSMDSALGAPSILARMSVGSAPVMNTVVLAFENQSSVATAKLAQIKECLKHDRYESIGFSSSSQNSLAPFFYCGHEDEFFQLACPSCGQGSLSKKTADRAWSCSHCGDSRESVLEGRALSTEIVSEYPTAFEANQSFNERFSCATCKERNSCYSSRGEETQNAPVLQRAIPITTENAAAHIFPIYPLTMLHYAALLGGANPHQILTGAEDSNYGTKTASDYLAQVNLMEFEDMGLTDVLKGKLNASLKMLSQYLDRFQLGLMLDEDLEIQNFRFRLDADKGDPQWRAKLQLLPITEQNNTTASASETTAVAPSEYKVRVSITSIEKEEGIALVKLAIKKNKSSGVEHLLPQSKGVLSFGKEEGFEPPKQFGFEVESVNDDEIRVLLSNELIDDVQLIHFRTLRYLPYLDLLYIAAEANEKKEVSAPAGYSLARLGNLLLRFFVQNSTLSQSALDSVLKEIGNNPLGVNYARLPLTISNLRYNPREESVSQQVQLCWDQFVPTLVSWCTSQQQVERAQYISEIENLIALLEQQIDSLQGAGFEVNPVPVAHAAQGDLDSDLRKALEDLISDSDWVNRILNASSNGDLVAPNTTAQSYPKAEAARPALGVQQAPPSMKAYTPSISASPPADLDATIIMSGSQRASLPLEDDLEKTVIIGAGSTPSPSIPQTMTASAGSYSLEEDLDATVIISKGDLPNFSQRPQNRMPEPVF
ncbi:MAG: hypothetical protein OEZ47_08550, partial [Gammaproteobacteria bacterium]|nr:hypothetical protein [Gammaproteobacteria bacterium]